MCDAPGVLEAPVGGEVNIPKVKEFQLMAKKTLILLRPVNYLVCAVSLYFEKR